MTRDKKLPGSTRRAEALDRQATPGLAQASSAMPGFAMAGLAMTGLAINRPAPPRPTAIRLCLASLAIAAFLAFRLAASPALAAESPLVAAFKTYLLLESVESGRIHRLELGPEVFSRLAAPPQSDLAVFDGQGKLVPFFVRAVPQNAPAAGKTISETVDLPVFRLPPGARALDAPQSAESLAESGLEIKYAGPDSREVTVKIGGELKGEAARPGEGGKFFVLDLGSLKNSPNSPLAASLEAATLAVNLGLGGEGEVAAKADVFGSDDLSDWRALMRDAPLIRLSSGDKSLSHSQFELDAARVPRYVLIAAKSLEADLAWASLRIERPASSPKGAPSLSKASFSGEPGKSPKTVIFDTKGRYPAQTANFILASPYLGEAVLEVESIDPAKDGPWRRLGKFKLFLIKNAQGDARSEPAQVEADWFRYWRLTFDDAAPEALELAISWAPLELVFMAQGPGPFTLAVGSSRPMPPPPGLGVFRAMVSAAQEADLARAEIGKPWTPSNMPLATAEAHDDAPKGSRVGAYITRGLLAVAVLLLTSMGIRLLRKEGK